jgi:hypothetical protein
VLALLVVEFLADGLAFVVGERFGGLVEVRLQDAVLELDLCYFSVEFMYLVF